MRLNILWKKHGLSEHVTLWGQILHACYEIFMVYAKHDYWLLKTLLHVVQAVASNFDNGREIMLAEYENTRIPLF